MASCSNFFLCCAPSKNESAFEFRCMSSGELIDRMGSERSKLEQKPSTTATTAGETFMFDFLDSSDDDAKAEAADIVGTTSAFRGRRNSNDNSMARTKSLVDGRLLDDYVLGSVLGQGSFGIVFACRKKHSDAAVASDLAVKLVDKVEAKPEDIIREVRTQQRLEHPNILKVHEVIEEKCFWCLVTDRYWGGDLVKCLKSHLQSGRRIRSSKITHLVRQMVSAIAYLHGLYIVHRDVKADNYLLDRVTLTDSKCHVVLADFGFACECRLGDRLSRRCGTRGYWPPELWDRSYTTKVDLWAMGVTLYAVVEGAFPFATEWDVKNKEVKLHPLLNTKCAELINQLLSKSEAMRPTATQALAHKWLLSQSDDKNSSDDDAGDFDLRPNMEAIQHDRLVDPGIAARRLELVERLEGMHHKQRIQHEGSLGSRGSRGGRPRLSDESSIDSANATPVAMLSNPTFVVVDKPADKIRTFEWRPEHNIKAMISQNRNSDGGGSMETANTDMDGVLRGSNAMLVGQILESHGINTSRFGRGSAKTLERFAQELESGASQLMVDAAKHKALVRVVDVVLLRLCWTNDEGSRSYLIVTADEQPDGRYRAGLNRLPGTKKRPYENVRNAAERIVMEMPDIDIEEVRFIFDCPECMEEEEESLSYPGVRTVYRKEVVSGVLTTNISEGGDLKHHRSARSTKFFTWLSDEECDAKGVKLWATTRGEEVSALVPAPIGLKVKALGRFLKANNIDLSAFGKGQSKTLQELSTELMAGECSLRVLPAGGVVRIVDVVLLQITNAVGDQAIVVSKETSASIGGKDFIVNRMPGTKRRPDENQFHAAKRVLQRQLKIPENLINLDADAVRIFQEEKDSPSYPGLQTVYCKRIISAQLQLMPKSSVTGSTGAGVLGRSRDTSVGTIGNEGRPQTAPHSSRYWAAMMGR